MNTLIYFNTKLNLNKKNLGGIESLNLHLKKELTKKKINCVISNKITNNISKRKWDNLISSNDSSVFEKVKSKKNILWLHNKLQIEKALRKKQLLPIFKNEIYSVFNSRYLLENTSSIYFFKEKLIIPNFLTKEFENLKINYRRKPYFVWSVQRERGLNDLINLWIKKVYPNNKSLKLFIFGININKIKSFKINYKRYNIFFKGRVNKSTLIKYYKNSLGMICLGYDETFCLNAIESYACGLPILTFGLTAVSEISTKKNSFRGSNFNHIYKHIVFLSEMNAKSRKKLIDNCVNYSKKYYIKNIIGKWVKLLKVSPNVKF